MNTGDYTHHDRQHSTGGLAASYWSLWSSHSPMAAAVLVLQDQDVDAGGLVVPWLATKRRPHTRAPNSSTLPRTGLGWLRA
jgi:hypothetical protein